MELRQTRRILNARAHYLKGVIAVSALLIIIAAIFCQFVVNTKQSIAVFAGLTFAILIIAISIIYDMYVNSNYRIFIDGKNIYVYNPSRSSRAGDEFIFYHVEDLESAKISKGSIYFKGHFTVKTDTTEREDINTFQNPAAFFADVFSTGTYKIEKSFRVSRIYEKEDLLMDLLLEKVR